MEGSRVLADQPHDPHIRLSNKLFGFVKNLKIEDKGSMMIEGKVSAERKNEETDAIDKTVKVASVKLVKNARLI